MQFSELLVLLGMSALCFGLCPTPTINQALQSSWLLNEVEEYFLWTVEIHNIGDEALLYLSLTISANMSQYWEVVNLSSGLFTLPEWRKTNGGIPANHNHTFGFVSIGSANVIVSSSFCDPLEPEPSLFQVSTLQALSAGLLEGIYPIGLLKKHGDFGLGTYAGINGEMIVLDGHYYHAYADGHVEEADDSELTPFAVVVAFKAQSSFNITTPSSLAELSTLIASIVPTDNFFYAIKLHGHFSSVTTRAIPFMNRPYPTLTEALEFQVVVTSGNLDGTAVVIRGPQYTANLNVAGDHFHFISDDHHFGGHALSLTMAEGTLEVQQIRKFTVWLPDSQDFREGDLPK